MSTIDPAASPGDLRALAEQSKAWPFEQAKAIVARLKKKPKDEVLFETGYGPSGLPHIGTFGEVARTTMVRYAFRVLTDDKVKTRLIAFSDDMDGLRKVPDNVPNKEMLEQHLGEPLTRVPDPFGTHQSFGAHNNARLRAFLDAFGFDYEFASSTDYYTSGKFDATLLRVLERVDQVMAVMLPSLREERAASYSPFLPICPRTGVVLYVPIAAHDVKAGTISYDDPETKERVTLPVTGGHCKLQWKPDWAMRWVALGVDYEMAGKDLIDSVKLSGKICIALGGTPPEGFNYELFLDEYGQKISKSKGNGLTIDEWLRYASPESLSCFMYREPKAAKRLHFDVIPRTVDEYQQSLDGFPRQDAKQQLANPVWHIHAGNPPAADMPVTFQLLLTLVSSSNAENAATLWGFIGRYRPGVTPQTHPKLDAMVGYAINYYRDFVAPTKQFREPTPTERAALQDLRDALSQLPAEASAEDIQNVVYEIGRREPFLDAVKKGKDGRPGVSLDWFNMLYQVLLGQEKGPRFGSFVAVYGLSNAVAMIDGALARSAKPEPNNAEAIRKIAEQALQDALEIYQLIALLRAKNTDSVNSSLARVGAVTASATLQNALISRLVLLVMRAYDEPRSGEQNLRAAVEMLKTDQTAREIFDLGQKVKKVSDFEEQWTKCFGDHRRPKIKNFRDKRTAHLGRSAEDIADAEYRELFEFGEATAQAMELLALGTGVAVKPVTGNNNAAAEADAIWKPWQISSKSPD
jgi:lysyl-tRNA synthetase class 1